jgi:chemotaxis protein methyltransferase CheR
MKKIIPNLAHHLITGSQIDTILEDLAAQHKLDLYFYSRESFDRRIHRLFQLENITNFEAFRTRLNSDGDYVKHVIDRITVNVTEMFRDASFFKSLRNEIIPELAKLPFIRVWHPGCSSGEEVVSLAILFQEAGVLERCEIIGTDLNSKILERAKLSQYSVTQFSTYEKNYSAIDAPTSLRTYFEPCDFGFQLKSDISSRIHYQSHNLASGEYLGKFDLIVCRNVLIYFDRSTVHKAFDLFHASTTPQSYLALGEKETLQLSTINTHFDQNRSERIWKKR